MCFKKERFGIVCHFVKRTDMADLTKFSKMSENRRDRKAKCLALCKKDDVKFVLPFIIITKICSLEF